MSIQTEMADDLGFTYGGINYWREGAELTLANLPTDAPGKGYRYVYTYGSSTLSGTILTVGSADYSVDLTLAPIDWATVNQGTKDDPYMIYNKDQLLLLAYRVNGTHGETANDYNNKYFKLGADITFSYDPNEDIDDYEENYEAIGGYINGNLRFFKGDFNGDNKTVSGIRINKSASDSADGYQGLFGCINTPAEIYDVHVTDARIKGYENVGGIVGYNDDGYITRCTVTESAITATKSTDHCGTICGRTSYNNRLTDNFYRHCTVNGSAVTSGNGCDGADITDNDGAMPMYVAYIDADGNQQRCIDYTELTGGGATTLNGGWYVVGKDITYTGTVTLDGDVTIILADGKTMNIGTSEMSPVTGSGINGSGYHSLTIYGQSDQSGTLNAYSNNNCAVYVKSYAQHGGITTFDNYTKGSTETLKLSEGALTLTRGILNATARTTTKNNYTEHSAPVSAAIALEKGYTATVSGGTLNATASGFKSYTIYGNIIVSGGTLNAYSSGRMLTYAIYYDLALSGNATATVTGGINGDVTIADGSAFADEDGNIYTGTLSSDEKSKLNGKTLTPFNGCYPPKNLTATDIAVTTATLTWEKGNDETQWQVKWSTDGGETWTSPVTVNSTQYEMTNLNPVTTFQVQVLSVYGEGQYSSPKSITFTTHSASDAPIELTSNATANTAVLSWKGFQDGYNMRYRQASVFPEDFESYADDAAFNAVWTVIDLGGGENADELGLSADAAKTSTKGFRFSSYDYDESSSYDQYLISPILPKGETLTFAYKSSHGTKDTFRVGYSTTTNDLSAFEWGDEINSEKEWQTFEQEIPEGAKYFAINYTGKDEWRLYIDDITINGMQAADWENKTNVTNPQTITDLTPETKYEWQVQGIVDDKETEWSTVAYFTTNYKVSYIDENGEEQTTIAHTLNGSETMLAPGWYFVQNTNPDGVDLAYENALSCYKGDLNIILCDGAKMTVDVLEGKALFLSGNNRTLTIYGQSEGTGRLTVTGAASGNNPDGTIDVSNMIINGGIVSATSNVGDHAAIHSNVTLNRGQLTVNNDGSMALEGKLTVNGGRFMAYSGVEGTIHFNGGTFSATGVIGDIHLNWTNPSDRFYVGGNFTNDLFFDNGKIFVDEDGTLYQPDENGCEGISYQDPSGKTLRPFKTITLADNADNSSAISEWNGGVAEVTLSGRTLYKDGDWNTLCLPFDLAIKESALDGNNVKAMVLDGEKSELKGDELTLNFVDAPATIPAGTPFIIKWDKTDNLVNPVFTGVTIDDSNNDVTSKDGNVSFKGTYAPINWNTETPSILFVGEKNQLHWPLAGAHLNACRAYFELADGEQARSFNLNFGEETSDIVAIDNSQLTIHNEADAWYTLDGRKVSGKPTTKGLYIHNGKKVVIK